MRIKIDYKLCQFCVIYFYKNKLDFYKEIFDDKCQLTELFLKEQNNIDIGHFNIFNIAEMGSTCKSKPVLPYNRRTYYKISWINRHNKVEFAYKEIEVKQKSLDIHCI